MNSPISILTFHHVHPAPDRITVPPSLFESVLKAVRRHYTFISYRHFIEMLTGERAITKRLVLLTLDDGYLDNFIYAYPILKALSVPAVIFVITQRVKPSSTRRKKMGFVKHNELKRTHDPAFYINTAELQDMRASGLISFASHTHTHMICRNKSETELRQEFYQSHDLLRQWTRTPPPYGFCWPGGAYDQTALKSIRNSPFAFAFSTVDGGWRRGDDAYTIRRVDCSSFSGNEKDYHSRVKRKLFIYSTPIIGNWYSRFKQARAKLRLRAGKNRR